MGLVLVVTSQSVQLASVANCSALAKLMIPMYLLCLRVQIGVENGCYWTEYNWNTEHLVFGREAHCRRLTTCDIVTGTRFAARNRTPTESC